MATYKDLQECFDLTGINPAVLADADFSSEDLKNLNPKVYRYIVWKFKKKENPDLKFSDVQDFDFKELREAMRDFFLKDTPIGNP